MHLHSPLTLHSPTPLWQEQNAVPISVWLLTRCLPLSSQQPSLDCLETNTIKITVPFVPVCTQSPKETHSPGYPSTSISNSLDILYASSLISTQLQNPATSPSEIHSQPSAKFPISSIFFLYFASNILLYWNLTFLTALPGSVLSFTPFLSLGLCTPCCF